MINLCRGLQGLGHLQICCLEGGIMVCGRAQLSSLSKPSRRFYCSQVHEAIKVALGNKEGLKWAKGGT